MIGCFNEYEYWHSPEDDDEHDYDNDNHSDQLNPNNEEFGGGN